MARYLVLWRVNPAAPWPTDPSETLKLLEVMWATIDDLQKKGEIEEGGYFLDGNSGYAIVEGDGMDIFRQSNMFLPYMAGEIQEIITFEKAKEITKALLEAQIAATKK
ncbi:MAG: hypothetical protein GTN80_01720 [Nitrososphaeria archaeon]|nr:hypothetical protein [Nitrososphaeria archaeon]NIN51822.1 hypothetical protein [Nitrososphaeria archaeon]NIQ32357.1 hypothetical protein [Nitrososphaeria archaeon]